jgi:hypothetical protein
MLEAADDADHALEAARESHKFSELPPELKNRVYIPTSTFACIKHLYIELRHSPIESPFLAYSVDLADGRCAQSSRGYLNWEGSQHDQNQSNQHVRNLVNSITTREGQAKLEKDDFEAFEVAIRKDMFPHWR